MMKIIVPLAGENGQFQTEFNAIKPLVDICGRSMVELACDMFPSDSHFIFICKDSDLDTNALRAALQGLPYRVSITALSFTPSSLLDTLCEANDLMQADDEFIILHPDSISQFSFTEFISQVRLNKAAAALTTFKGFTPFDLNGNDYCRVTIDEEFVISLIEKSPLRQGQVTAAGVYYFSLWGVFLADARESLKNQSQVNGRYFEADVFNQIIRRGGTVVHYPVGTFLNFGSPEYVSEYKFWLRYFSNLTLPNENDHRSTREMSVLIPAAGLGKRFADEGYLKPKPLIDVFGRPMIVSSAMALPKGTEYIFVVLEEHCKQFGLDQVLFNSLPNCTSVTLREPTQGMACTCLMAAHLLAPKKPLLVSSCDYSFVYDDQRFGALLDAESPDAVIFTFRRYPDARLAPLAYAYLVLGVDGRVERVSEKVPVSDEPHNDHVVQGVFYFKSAELFEQSATEMIRKKNSVNGEYYVATAINELIERGCKVLPFEVDQYICWGTPLDLRTFEFYKRIFSSL